MDTRSYREKGIAVKPPPLPCTNILRCLSICARTNFLHLWTNILSYNPIAADLVQHKSWTCTEQDLLLVTFGATVGWKTSVHCHYSVSWQGVKSRKRGRKEEAPDSLTLLFPHPLYPPPQLHPLLTHPVVYRGAESQSGREVCQGSLPFGAIPCRASPAGYFTWKGILLTRCQSQAVWWFT